MKKSMFAVFFLISGLISAQNFEGIINWSIKSEIKDPKMKAQMEEAQKRMNDPEMQAQMKQLEAQMQDPQFKAMMESNPQMKAQMEKMMAMTSSGSMDAVIPKGMLVKVKDGNTLTRMDGGLFDGDILYIKEKGTSYHLDHKNKTYSSMGSSGGRDVNATVTKTGESSKVAGYTCQKYQVDLNENDKKITQWIWSTTEIQGLDMSGMYSQDIRGKGAPAFYKEIEGVPLKVEMDMPEMNVIMEATSVKRSSLPGSEFVIPSAYKEVKGM